MVGEQVMVSKKFLFTGFMVLSIIALGTMFVYAQEGPATTVDFSDAEEVTLTGTISSVDDRGLTILSDEESYYIVLPYSFDRSALDLTVGAEVSVTGFLVDSPNYGSAIHATSINGLVIDRAPQQQLHARAKDGSGDCDGSGNGGMGGNGQHRGGMKG